MVGSHRTTLPQTTSTPPPSQSRFKLILYFIFPLILLFNTNPVYSTTITYSLPGMNHVLTQEASLNLPGQHNIFTNLHQEHHPPSSFWRQFSLLKKVVQPNITVGTKNATLHFATLHQAVLPTAILPPATQLLVSIRHHRASHPTPTVLKYVWTPAPIE